MKNNQSAAPAADVEGLTDEQIQEAATEAVRAGSLSWLGFERDSDGKFTVPVLSKCHFQFARAVEREVLATRPSVDLSGMTRYSVHEHGLAEDRNGSLYLVGDVRALLATKAVEAVQPAGQQFGASAGLTPEYKAAQQAKNEAATAGLARLARQDQAGAVAIPFNVRAALARMCNPLDESRLGGVTAKEDARCMHIIKEFIDGLAAPTQATVPQRVEVPEGWRLVPLEADDDMISAACEASNLFRVDAMRAIEAAIAAAPVAQEGEQSAGPLNGIPATMRHDEGAIARCSYCRRYSLDPATLSGRQPVCDCGKQYGWSGSFKRPGPDAKWSGKAPATPSITKAPTQPTPSDSGSVNTPTDLSEQLRERARGGYTAVHTDDGALMLKAADEIERYYGGMLAWKKTAEKKDADWNAERMARVNDRCTQRAADSAESVDTAEFRKLLRAYDSACVNFNACNGAYGSVNILNEAHENIIAHIESLVAGARKDAERLEQIEQHRVRLTPEYEGGFIAEVYGDDEVPQAKGEGKTARAAIDAAIAAHSPATSSKES